jgi:hypothetical protein
MTTEPGQPAAAAPEPVTPVSDPAPAAPAAPPAGDPTPPAPPAAGEPPAGAEPSAPRWPDDWRKNIAGDDEKSLKRLERFTDPKALFESYRALEKKLTSGELKQAKAPEDPEELKAWRKEAGIPETPDAYDLGGLEIDKTDKPLVDAFLTAMHGKNATPELVSTALATYYDLKAQEIQQRQEADTAARDETMAELMAEWGGDYKRNVSMVNGLVEMAPEGVRDQLKSARLGDGTPLFSSPDALRYFAHLAREINPAATVVPTGSDPMRATEGRIKEIETLMADRRSEYWQGPKASQMQAEYRDLLTARQKLAARG